MPFARPDLATLRAQAKSDVQAAIAGSNPLLRFTNLGVLADVLGEGFNGEYAYLDWIAKQAVPFTADEEAFEAWAAMKGVVRKPATQASYPMTFTGVTGTPLPAGTPIARGDGVNFTTLADQSVDGAGNVTVEALADVAGAAGTTEVGTAVALGVAIAGIAAQGVVAAGGTPGVDIEDFDAFKTRTLGVYAKPPQGGAASDYEEWALQVAGVTRAWCVGLGMGPGTVIVYFMMDLAEAAFGGFPQGTNGVATDETRDVAATGDQLLVADHIYPLRPVTALVYAVAPGQNVVTFTINLPGASAEVKAAVADGIDAVFLAYGSPGGVVNNDVIDAAIRAIAGTSGFVVTAEGCTHGAVAPGSAGNITSNDGYLPVRGVITWTP